MKKFFVLFGILFFCGMLAVNAQTVSVTFNVDMSVQIAKEVFNPAEHQISVRGGFNDWGETPMTDGDGDKIYTVTVSGIAANSNIEYKFYHSASGGVWEDGDNKKVTLGTSDVTLDPVFFNGEGMPSGAATNVTFNVDMRLPTKQSAFIPGTDAVNLAGSFNDWNTSATPMLDSDGDTVYTATIEVNSATLLKYKYTHTGGSTTNWETISDRKYWVVDGTNEVTQFWDNVDPNVQLADGAISFQADVSVLEEIGLFNQSSDSVQVRGAFNGWSSANVAKSLMNQDFLNPSMWFIDVPFVQTEVNSVQEYKFRLQVADQNSPLGGDAGYERPRSTGGGNRSVEFEGLANQQTLMVYFNDVLPDFVIPAGQTVSITFNVNMQPATDPALQAVPFVPATDRVFWQPGQAAFAATMGWTEGQDSTFEMFDPDGDLVYSGTMTIVGPSFNAFVYSYQFLNAGGLVNEPTGFANNVRRVRHIAMTGARAFVQPYDAPVDKWTNAENKSDQIEDNPPGYVSVREVTGLTPYKFSLDQNYPNPFNPTTNIRFTIPESGLVTLKVYNLIGEEIETLLNTEMTSGVYEVNFDASKLSSGVYFYTINAGKFNASKKMLLVK
jgi:hypothetical protein